MTVKVTFVPIPGFSGTAKGVTVSPMASVGRDRDGKMSDNALKTATDKYRPTVTPVTSVGNKIAIQTGFTEGDIRVSINDAVTVTFEDSTTPKTWNSLGSYKVACRWYSNIHTRSLIYRTCPSTYSGSWRCERY